MTEPTETPQLHPPLKLETWNRYIEKLRTVLPLELLKKKAWLRWRAILDPKACKIKKVPFPPYNQVENYLPFAAASRFEGAYAGLGLANVGQDFTIIDIDRNLQPPHEFDNANKDFGVYWEMSPSRLGLRSFRAGRLPEGGPGTRLVKGAEVYRDKWATVTGDALQKHSRYQLQPLPEWLITEWALLARAESLDRGSNNSSTEPGPWSVEMMQERLDAWDKFVAGFSYRKIDDCFAIPCPGDAGWPDGAKHTYKEGYVSKTAMVWVRNRLPVFHCFHAHCADKTWKDFQNFYDPDRLWHTVEESIENYLIKMQGGEWCPR